MIQFDANTIFWFVLDLTGSSIASFAISWFFSTRFRLVADIVTVPSVVSKYSEEDKIGSEEGYTAYDTYVVLVNHSNQSIEMKDFAPLNMPRIIINGGKLQDKENAYYVLTNPDPFAMYNNVKLKYDDVTISISFDQLKKGQSIEIVVHTLIKDNSPSKIKLAVAATLKNGAFICKKQLRSYHMIVQTIMTYVLVLIFVALPIFNGTTRYALLLLLIIWGPLSGKIVNYVSYYAARMKIVKKITRKK